jgi:hypothetical protein
LKKDLIAFIKNTQENKYQELQENFGTDADREIIKALELTLLKKELWLVIREGLTVKGNKSIVIRSKAKVCHQHSTSRKLR